MGANRKEYGPVSAEQLKSWVLEGRATAKTQVSVDGSPWAPLGSLPEFTAEIAAKKPSAAPRAEPARVEPSPRARDDRPRNPQRPKPEPAGAAPRADRKPPTPRRAPDRQVAGVARPDPRQKSTAQRPGGLAVEPTPRPFHNYATLKPAVEHPLVKKAMLAGLLGLLPLPIIGSTVGVILSLKALNQINTAPHEFTTPASKARLALMVSITGFVTFLVLYASGFYGRVFGGGTGS